MAKKYLIHHHPERSLPDEFTDDFCRIWLFKLETYRYINVRPLAYCCGLDRIIQTTQDRPSKVAFALKPL